MDEEIRQILQEWDESRGLSGVTPTGVGEEKIARAGRNLRALLRLPSFRPWKRSTRKDTE